LAKHRCLIPPKLSWPLIALFPPAAPAADSTLAEFEQTFGDIETVSIATGRVQPLRTAPPDARQVARRVPEPGPEALLFELLTPLRIKHRGRYISPAELSARALLDTLAARVSLLAELYAPPPSPTAQDPLAPQAEPQRLERGAVHAAINQIQIDTADLRWVDWTRYSSRQRTQMQLGGLLGQMRLSGPGIAPLWPLIALGQWLHLGKNTSFGLGRYRVTAAAPPQG